MEVIKRLGDCSNNYELNIRLKALRENIVKCSKGQLKYTSNNEDNSSIYVDWNWINRIEIRSDSSKEAIAIEVWVADVKHQWKDLSKISSMKFLENKDNVINVLDIKAEKSIGAYVKFGDPFGNTLKWANIKDNHVKDTFTKTTYSDFYKTLGGQWRLNSVVADYVKSDKKLLEEIKKMELVEEDKQEFLTYVENAIENETRSTLNMSLGTTIKTYIPIKELQEKDKNFNYANNVDELARPICDLILKYKKEIEE